MIFCNVVSRLYCINICQMFFIYLEIIYKKSYYEFLTSLQKYQKKSLNPPYILQVCNIPIADY